MNRKPMRKKACGRILTFILVLALSFLNAGYAEAKQGAANNRFNVVFVLDASNSMNYTDPNGLRFEAISQFINLLAEQGNGIGGVVFSDQIRGRQDLAAVNGMDEKKQVTDMLKSVAATGYTNIGEGLFTAVSMIDDNGNPELPSVILLLSDGNTEMPTKEGMQTSLDRKADAIQSAREKEISIYSVCLNANSNADVTEMKQISDATGGEFREVTKAEDLQDVFNTFYNLIYGTSTIELADVEFPPSGRIETPFNIPGIGVEEVNIIIYGSVLKTSLVSPDGIEKDVSSIDLGTFSMIKMTDVRPGEWLLVTEGKPGNRIRINMVYNTNLCVDINVEPNEKIINPADQVKVKASLGTGAVKADDSRQYTGYTAQLLVTDAYGEELQNIPMSVVRDHFEADCGLEEGTYYFKVKIGGNYLEKESEPYGPLTVTKDALSEEEKNNTSPEPIDNPVKDSVNIWPFAGGSYSLDLNTLAKDKQDAKLRYKIVSSSFIEGEDYTVDSNGLLTLDHFSLSKGAFTVRATDSGGLSCDIEVIVKSHNIGIIALIFLGVAALVALAVLGLLFYMAMTKPFYGTIRAQSYCDGKYRGTDRKPRRGRCKLSLFGMDNIGLDYNKSYFQATGQQYVYLITKTPVIWNGQKTNKVRIQSGAEVTLTVNEGDSRRLYVRFDSRIRKIKYKK